MAWRKHRNREGNVQNVSGVVKYVIGGISEEMAYDKAAARNGVISDSVSRNVVA